MLLPVHFRKALVDYMEIVETLKSINYIFYVCQMHPHKSSVGVQQNLHAEDSYRQEVLALNTMLLILQQATEIGKLGKLHLIIIQLCDSLSHSVRGSGTAQVRTTFHFGRKRGHSVALPPLSRSDGSFPAEPTTRLR